MSTAPLPTGVDLWSWVLSSMILFPCHSWLAMNSYPRGWSNQILLKFMTKKYGHGGWILSYVNDRAYIGPLTNSCCRVPLAALSLTLLRTGCLAFPDAMRQSITTKYVYIYTYMYTYVHVFFYVCLHWYIYWDLFLFWVPWRVCGMPPGWPPMISTFCYSQLSLPPTPEYGLSLTSLPINRMWQKWYDFT